MKVTRLTKWAFTCPVCSEIHTPDSELEPKQAWDLGSAEVFATGSGGIVFEAPLEIKAYRYNDEDAECVGVDEPEYTPGYQCGECETIYIDKDEARECCKS
jgi:hypothetical protein